MHGDDVTDRLQSAGFEVSTEDYVRTLESDVVERYGLRERNQWIHDRTLVFHCPKPHPVAGGRRCGVRSYSETLISDRDK